MTGPLNEDHDLLAAEHALGVLEGPDLQRARELVLSSPEFARSVRDWELTLSPIADEATEQAPQSTLWERIEKSLEDKTDEPVVLALRRRIQLWRGVSFAAMATAAALALFVALQQTAQQQPGADDGRGLLLASLSSADTNTSLSAAYDPDGRSLLVSPGVLKSDAEHQHELWIIPQGGAPVAVGLLHPGQPQRLAVRSEIVPHFRARSTLAVSVEPMGGSPTGQPTGPVIAAGQLSSI